MRLKKGGQVLVVSGVIVYVCFYVLNIVFNIRYLYPKLIPVFPVVSFIMIVSGSGLWGYDFWQTGIVKKRMIYIEDSIRRAKIISMETKFGDEFEVTMDSLRTELSNLYLYAKSGSASRKILDNGEEFVGELIISIENRDEVRTRRNISSLRNIVADLRSQFRR